MNRTRALVRPSPLHEILLGPCACPRATFGPRPG